MRKYLGLASILILIVTFLILQFFFVGKVSGQSGTNLLITGVSLSLICALLSTKGTWKNIAFSGLAILLIIFILGIVSFFGI
ncbi:hypothetical protein ACFQ4X_03525 [Fictibacillus halophilus]|uniref:hypothetical protein n=1 Tax=Fictibacillus halophilus TaxID=1610490 RepID=UPI003625C44B